jgi:hypothetical protein
MNTLVIYYTKGFVATFYPRARLYSEVPDYTGGTSANGLLFSYTASSRFFIKTLRRKNFFFNFSARSASAFFSDYKNTPKFYKHFFFPLYCILPSGKKIAVHCLFDTYTLLNFCSYFFTYSFSKCYLSPKFFIVN